METRKVVNGTITIPGGEARTRSILVNRCHFLSDADEMLEAVLIPTSGASKYSDDKTFVVPENATKFVFATPCAVSSGPSYFEYILVQG